MFRVSSGVQKWVELDNTLRFQKKYRILTQAFIRPMYLSDYIQIETNGHKTAIFILRACARDIKIAVLSLWVIKVIYQLVSPLNEIRFRN